MAQSIRAAAHTACMGQRFRGAVARTYFQSPVSGLHEHRPSCWWRGRESVVRAPWQHGHRFRGRRMQAGEPLPHTACTGHRFRGSETFMRSSRLGVSGLPKRSKQLSPATASNSSRSGSGSRGSCGSGSGTSSRGSRNGSSISSGESWGGR